MQRHRILFSILFLILSIPIASSTPLLTHLNPQIPAPYNAQIHAITFDTPSTTSPNTLTTPCAQKTPYISSSSGLINISYPCQVQNIHIKFIVPKDKYIYQYIDNSWKYIPQTQIGITNNGQMLIQAAPTAFGTFSISSKQPTTLITLPDIDHYNRKYENISTMNQSDVIKKIYELDYNLYNLIKQYIINLIRGI